MTISKVSTEKQVQSQIVLIGDNFQNYCADNFDSFHDMCLRLISFRDFRVFLPIVCNDKFNSGYFNLITVNNEESALAFLVISRIYEEARLLHMKNLRSPGISGQLDLSQAACYVNIRKPGTCRLMAHFFLPEMPLKASFTKFGQIAMQRENVKRPYSFNLLSIGKHYVEGMPAVVEYYMMYGVVLSTFTSTAMKNVDKIHWRFLVKALEERDAHTAALHIRAFEHIPTSQRSRMRNRLISLGNEVFQHIKKSDKRYYFAFRNGFYQVGAAK